ncbi:MAG: DUF1854 domain-containing protein [Clostridia bacterium]|nr:DUF1854 domain-containing protein [Clostridia bacterium]
MARNYIGNGASFTQSELTLVDMTVDGVVTEGLSPRRLFPVFDKEHYISLLDADGREVGIIRDVSELSNESAEVIRNVLREYYIVPKITAMLDIIDKGGTLRFRVMTDRGERGFQIKSRITDIKVLENNRVLFCDTSDNRYEIPDWTLLDKRSKMLLATEI